MQVFLADMQHDLLCVTETWLNDKCNEALITSPEYKVISRSDRPTGGQGGGVIMLAKNSIVTEPIVLDHNRNTCAASDVCGSEITYNDKKNCLLTVYRPPSSSLGDDIELATTLRKFVTTAQNPIVVGDLNLPNVNWATRSTTHTSDKTILNVCNELELLQLIESRVVF